MAEIAERTGVSKATVSRSLAGSSLIGKEVRELVENVANGLGYVKKSQKRHAERSILTIKVVLPSGHQRSTQLFYSFMELVDGLRDGLMPSGANIIVETYSQNYSPFPHKKGGEIDAFVFAFHRPSTEVLAEIREQGAACVVMNRIVRGVRQVVSDHRDALQQIAAHLADQGVREGCCFVGYGGIGDVLRTRLKGFDEGCQAYGITFDPVLDSWTAASPDDFTREDVQAWYDRGYRTFVGVNDVVGLVLMQQVRSLDLRIPDDVRVTGCDCGPLHGVTYPRLTSVMLPVKKLAEEVGKSLQEEIVEKTKTQNVLVVKGELLVGGTT